MYRYTYKVAIPANPTADIVQASVKASDEVSAECFIGVIFKNKKEFNITLLRIDEI